MIVVVSTIRLLIILLFTLRITFIIIEFIIISIILNISIFFCKTSFCSILIIRLSLSNSHLSFIEFSILRHITCAVIHDIINICTIKCKVSRILSVNISKSTYDNQSIINQYVCSIFI